MSLITAEKVASTLYEQFQHGLSFVFSPTPPPRNAQLGHTRIAIIGAGLTGVSAAAHCIGHGFDVTIFEAGGRNKLGGIWTQVNSTSGLQIHSAMYRFHPSVEWANGYPKRNQIVDAIEQLWQRYGLDDHTIFDTRVSSVERTSGGRWVVNRDYGLGEFDGIIAAVGTCGEPQMPELPKQSSFAGGIYHSSALDGESAKDKNVLIVGGGASAVEALEWAIETGAEKVTVLARSEKWVIPRNAVIDSLLAFNIFGRETTLSWLPETALRLFFYRDLEQIAPSGRGLFTETPMVNSRIFDEIREGRAEWLRGDIVSVAKTGINFNMRAKGTANGDKGHETLVDGDIIVMATGFKRPSLDFLPAPAFEKPYQPPNWYLQVFPPDYPTVCANNCTYVNAIGTVGNYHIGIYTRLLLVFLADPLATPRPWLMRRWVDAVTLVKRFAPTPALDFFTYSELMMWFVFSIAINPFRWKWALFVLFGIGQTLPAKILAQEDRLRGKKDGVVMW